MVRPWSEVEVVLFDWNGTLVDDIERASSALEVVLARRRLPALGLDGFRRSFHLPLRGWLSELGFADADLEAAEADWNREMRSRPTGLQSDAAALLALLRKEGRRVGVVSAASDRSVRSDLHDTGLDNLVELVVADSDDKVRALVDIMNGAGRRGVYVGDVEYDIEAGREAGLLTVGFTGGYRPRAALEQMRPDALIDELVELGGVLGLTAVD